MKIRRLVLRICLARLDSRQSRLGFRTSDLGLIRKGGFSYVELLVALAILGVLLTITLNLFSASIFSYRRSERTLELQSNGNYVLSVIESKIRNAESLRYYQDQEDCQTNCASGFILVDDKKNPGQCSLIRINAGIGEPDLWTTNGYVFVEDMVCPTDISAWASNIPTTGRPISNRNQGNPANGVNVTNLLFEINELNDGSYSIKTTLDLRQGTTGAIASPGTRADLTLESTTTLR